MYAWGLFGLRFARQVTILSYRHKIRTCYLSPFFIYKDNLFQALLYHQYVFRLVQRVSKKTKKPLLLCLFLQQKSEIWILLTMPVKYWLPSPTRWKLEATLSMKDGTKILLLQRVSVLFFPPYLAGNWVKFQLNEPLSLDYEQSLFFLGPSSKTPETRKWPRAWLKARDGRGSFFFLGCRPRFSRLAASTLNVRARVHSPY